MSEQIITVKVRAKARERSIKEGPDGILRIKTTVAPEKGRANEDVVDMLADYFMIPKSHVTLLTGASTPMKRFKIST